MSFLSDAFEGHFDKLGTDITHAGSSLMSHPSEMYETLGGAAVLATGGLALGALPELGAAGAAAAGGDILTGGAALGLSPEVAAASGGFEAATGGTEALGFGTQALTNAAGEALPAIDPLAQGAGSEVASVGKEAADVAASSSGGFMSNLASGAVNQITKNPLGIAAAGAGLGMNLLHGNQMDPNQQKLQDYAAQLGAQGQVLESYLKTGKLPPALQAQLDQAKQSEKARIISGYAQRGQPTDPRMNSALAQELNNVDTNAIAAMAKVQVDMLNTGLKETGMSMELYQMLTKLDMKQNEDLMKSISSFAAALGGGFGGAPARMA